jgi:hypothetical protein
MNDNKVWRLKIKKQLFEETFLNYLTLSVQVLRTNVNRTL